MFMNKVKLTPAEWEIMEAVWTLGGSPSIREVMELAYAGGEKAYTTIQTIMNTLEKKDLLRRKKTGLVHFYTPILSRSQVIKSEMTGMLSRIFNGSVPAFANCLFDSEHLSLDEIEEMKSLLNKKENELRGML
jgi:BlaI family transcriptional regulator, penicillinase repressor